jgi:hypothetical protein
MTGHALVIVGAIALLIAAGWAGGPYVLAGVAAFVLFLGLGITAEPRR